MFDFSQLKAVKAKTEQRDNNRKENAGNYLDDAVQCLKEFYKTHDNNLLQEAADKLILSLGNKRSQVEPYVYLSSIFYLLNDDYLAVKYFRIASSIDAGHPLVQRLKSFIV